MAIRFLNMDKLFFLIQVNVSRHPHIRTYFMPNKSFERLLTFDKGHYFSFLIFFNQMVIQAPQRKRMIEKYTKEREKQTKELI